ncbi:hypothetical protein GOP47_0010755 [Adiantum capillus-veneris]|uniref:R3H-associated N-terminal domain-containing protein n=1 Tax=Adiantum capillus-veneris TaxID=13818 RepID=A0A9D4UVI6_ADICA|nr:hypothetical protein GOP47_0010755 [Adiantum capillus-veneris]
MADKFGGSNAFHDWLSASAYVKGADQTARVVSRRKHRSKRNSGLPDLENERFQTEERIRALWKLSNRHYRRWMNDRLLRELAPPLDAQEIGSLFAPPPWGEKSLASPFERVSAYGESWAQEKAAWEPFRNNVDMDMEARVLKHVATHQGKTLSHDARRHKAAAKAWQGVSHRSRDVLRRSSSWHLVNIFEEKIIKYLEEVKMGGSNCLVLNVEDAYHRMLIHGICEFHGLSSKTISDVKKGEATENSHVIVKMNGKTVSKAGAIDDFQDMRMPLHQFLVDANKRTQLLASGA